jgi:hypothetical protein
MSISTSHAVHDDEGAFLSRAVVGSRELRLCLTLIGISAVIFVICVPYVRMSVQPSPAFSTLPEDAMRDGIRMSDRM